jgi:hypothetical protein
LGDEVFDEVHDRGLVGRIFVNHLEGPENWDVRIAESLDDIDAKVSDIDTMLCVTLDDDQR